MVASKAAENWLATWKREAISKSELELPIRLLEAAVTFRKTMDRRVLLALPLEERQLLEPLCAFGLWSPATCRPLCTRCSTR